MTDKTPTPRTEDTPTQFDYLLNAMEAAGLADKPAECGYGDKRKALFAHVRALERNLIACRAALVEISEYWNGSRNDSAMFDALNHIDEVAARALVEKS